MSGEEAGMPRGALVVVEGLDRAGKSSQCHLLKQSLESLGYALHYQKFPGEAYGVSITFPAEWSR